MNFGRRLLVICVFARCWFPAHLASAQQVTAVIRGTVFDPTSSTVSAASITAAQSETGFSRTVTSDAQGSFTFLELPVGHYRVQATAKGFQTFVQEGIALSINQTAVLRIQLVVGSTTQQIEVKGDAPLIENTATNLGQTVGEREILELPLNGRHFVQLGILQPGVVPITPGLAQAGGSLRDGQAYAVNGQRPELQQHRRRLRRGASCRRHRRISHSHPHRQRRIRP